MFNPRCNLHSGVFGIIGGNEDVARPICASSVVGVGMVMKIVRIECVKTSYLLLILTYTRNWQAVEGHRDIPIRAKPYSAQWVVGLWAEPQECCIL